MVDANIVVKRLESGKINRLQCKTCLDKPLRTHCARGHVLTPENILLKKQGKKRTDIWRRCKICQLTNERRWRAANRERYRIYHRDWNRRHRGTFPAYLYHAIKDNGRECLEPVL